MRTILSDLSDTPCWDQVEQVELPVNKIILGEALAVWRTWPSDSVDCIITSPPYYALRDYGAAGQMGLEKTPEEYLANMVLLFREIRRVLKPQGTVWINMGDSYIGSWGAQGHYSEMCSTQTMFARQKAAGIRKRKTGTAPPGYKPKDMIGMPWQLAMALRKDGWYLRCDIIWHKSNAMPESIKDRPSKCHEYIFLLSKSKRYYFDRDAILEECSPDTHLRVSKEVAAQMEAKKKVPAGWDTDGGGHHGSIHKGGRNGVNPKAKGDYVHKTGVGWNKGNPLAPERKGQRTKTSKGVKDSADFGRGPGWRNKQNESWSGATAGPVLKRAKRTVWEVCTQAFKGPHFATFPRKLIEPCVLAGCPPGGICGDPFMGTATTAQVAILNGRRFVGTELNPLYLNMCHQRLGLLSYF